MDKVYYKTLETDVEKSLYMDIVRKDRKREWDVDNSDKVYNYRRATTLRRCEQRISVPTKKTIEKYDFTEAELKPIFDALWSNRTGVRSSASADSDDKEGTEEENI